jgi:hypothetical protein
VFCKYWQFQSVCCFRAKLEARDIIITVSLMFIILVSFNQKHTSLKYYALFMFLF